MSIAILLSALTRRRAVVWRRLCVCALVALAGTAVAAQGATADECQQHFANDVAAQQLCLSRVLEAPSGDTPPASPVVAPLTHLQVMFGFYDRRFPGFNGGQEHTGVDYAAAAGAVVRAICDGTVVSTTTSRADIVSAVLVVAHRCAQPLGTVYGYYGHIHSALVEGDAVTAGAAIGTVREWPGNSHLHLALCRQPAEENWGTYPKATTLLGIVGQGWLNPMNYFTATSSGAASKRVFPQPAVNRKNSARDVRGDRRR